MSQNFSYQSLIDDHAGRGVHVIPRGSELYPQGLEQVPNPPSVLFAKGNIELLSRPPGVAIVGSRDASSNGLEIARRLAKYAVSQNQVVVSGLALGIDAAAHQGCIEAGGHTIVVLAHGLQEATPKANARLAQSALESGGLWISEHPWGVKPQRHFYVARNRIQVGLSNCSIIVESAVKSGTMKHADFCTQAGHPLFGVLPIAERNPHKLNCAGPSQLVRSGKAQALRSREDFHLLNI